MIVLLLCSTLVALGVCHLHVSGSRSPMNQPPMHEHAQRPGLLMVTRCRLPSWSTNAVGDRYVLKLFRDFVFHQSTEEGLPDLGRGHIVEALNKVDAGVPEQITLMSHDEMSIMVVSYADIKRCIDSVYAELKGKANAIKQVSRLRTPHR